MYVLFIYREKNELKTKIIQPHTGASLLELFEESFEKYDPSEIWLLKTFVSQSRIHEIEN